MQLKTKYPEETKIADLLWLENWYKEQCNGDREHSCGISIQTIDNPGWKLSVSLEDTELENAALEMENFQNSESDWYSFGIKNRSFIGIGDPDKLHLLIGKFRTFVESADLFPNFPLPRG